VEAARFVEAADVAGVEPAVTEGAARLFRRVEVAAGDVLALDENLPVVRDPDLDAANRLADGAAGGVERVIQRDDRGGLGQAVALYDEEPEAAPERFDVGIERRGADDHRPELEAEPAMGAAVLPPALRPVHPPIGHVSRLGHDPDQVVAQHLEDLRHRNQHRDAAAANLRHHVFRSEGTGEHHHAVQQRRHERRHRLAEHVAERKQVEEADRQERPGVLPVLRDFTLDRDDVGEDVPVREHHALRLRRGAGREDHLGDVVCADLDGGQRTRRAARRGDARDRPYRPIALHVAGRLPPR
jgi:hypothetical protein